MKDDVISRQQAILQLSHNKCGNDENDIAVQHDIETIRALPSTQPEIEESLYRYKCFITDAEGLQHEVVHVGDIRRVTGWEI